MLNTLAHKFTSKYMAMTDAEYLKHIRTELGKNRTGRSFTQTEMAEILGYSSYVSIGRIERGEENMSPQVRKFLEYIEENEC